MGRAYKDRFAAPSKSLFAAPSAIPSPGRFGDQIVIGVADDLDAGELAQGQFPANINPSVNVGRVRLAARDQKTAAPAGAGRLHFCGGGGGPDQAVLPG